MAEFEISPAGPADIDGLIDVHIANFGYHYFNSCMFAIDKITEPVFRRWLQRRWGKFFHHPEQRFFKVTETSTGKIVAWSRWGIPYHVTEEEKKRRDEVEEAESKEWVEKGELIQGTKYPVGANAEMATTYFGNFESYREKQYKPAEDYALNYLGVMPTHHRRGIGKMLLRPMLSKIDAEKKRCYLEATPSGHGLYLSLGWRDLEIIDGQPERWGVPGGKPYNDWVMIRDPQPVLQTETKN